VAPRRCERLAHRQLAQHHAVTAEQHPRHRFGVLLHLLLEARITRVVLRELEVRAARPQQGPASDRQRAGGRAAAAQRPETPLGPTLLVRSEERAQPGEAVTGDETARDQLPERLLRGRGQEARCPGDVAEERCAVAPQDIEHVACGA
jgi:hypothetical protein